MDYALLNLLITIAVLVATFLLRKRLFVALGRILFTKSIEFARATFLVETEDTTQDGTKVRKLALSGAARAIVAATTPVLVAEVAKSMKIRPGTSGTSLPEGLDLSNLSSALPAILNSGMIPKKYQGIVALAAPILQGFLGGGKGTAGGTTKGTSLEELDTGV